MGKGRYESSDDDPQDEDRFTRYQARNRRYHYDDSEEEEQDEYYGKHRPSGYRSHPSTYEEIDEEKISTPRRRSSSSSKRYDDDYSRPRTRKRPIRPVKQQRKRGPWLTLLAGCAIGIFLCIVIVATVALFAFHNLQTGGNVTNLPGLLTNHAFTQSTSQSFTTTNISAIVICDSVGNVTLTADSTATKPTVAIKKIVRTSSQSNADKMFPQISVAIQAPLTTETTTCPKGGTATSTATPTTSTPINNAVLITANIPGADTLNNAVDLTITLPSSMLTSIGPSMQLSINAPQGNISVNGISGLLTLQGNNGNINVTNAILTGGSHIGTATGNIVFSGYLSATGTGNQPAQYVMQSEHNITVTLSDNPNISVDANTNIGTITSDYSINVDHPVKDSASYNGPLNPANTTNSEAPPTLVLDVSTGNIVIHKLTA